MIEHGDSIFGLIEMKGRLQELVEEIVALMEIESEEASVNMLQMGDGR